MINDFLFFVSSDSETELVHNKPTGEEMMQEHLDEVKGVCVPDTPEMEEEQHLQQTEVKEPLIICLNVYPLPNLVP